MKPDNDLHDQEKERKPSGNIPRQVENEVKKTIPDFHLLPKIINGGVAGIVGVSSVFPLDLVKTRLQNQAIGPDGKPQYKNVFDCFWKTYRAEGFFGMYRGSGVNILLVTPEKAIKLSCNDLFRYFLTKADGTLSILRQTLAGGMTGFCQIVVTTPMELLKIQMQDAGRLAAEAKAAGKEFKRTSALALTRKLLHDKGIIGLYKGFCATAIRDVTFSMIYFPLFAELNQLGHRENAGAPFWWTFLSGLTSGMTSGALTNPLDVVKTRLQTLKGSGPHRSYSGWMDAVLTIIKYEGAMAFMKGVQCRVIVLAPLFGIAQVVYFFGLAEWLLGYK